MILAKMLCGSQDMANPNTLGEHPNTLGEHPNTLGEHIGSPLHRVVQWFKTMSTNEYIRGGKTIGMGTIQRQIMATQLL